MALVLHNSLTRKKEVFEPISDGKVGIYVCGVTVYDQSHLGHAKSAINFDIIVRYLRHKGFEVQHVTNFTDVDDKIIARAEELGIEPLELSQQMIDAYFRDMDALKVKRANCYPKASETISEIIEMISGLIEKGFAYESGGSVYFSVSKVERYGQLSGQSLDQMVSGARVEPGEDKRDPMDFALWKAAKPGEIAWESPWGKGRPGWHIECSAMCLKHIGPTVDIHGGGTELVFPHHENEILQSEAYNGAQFVKYWMHNGLLTIDEEKMSKSLKNFFLIRDLLSRYKPEVIRFYILNASYRQPLDYTERSLEESRKALEKLQNSYDSVATALKNASGDDDAAKQCEEAWAQIETRMDDDFSTREAIAAMYDLSREVNRLISEGRLSRKGAEATMQVYDKFNSLFDILRTPTAKLTAGDLSDEEGVGPEELETLLTKPELTDAEVGRILRARKEARSKKDFSTADKIRSRLLELGIEIQDTQEGAVWKRK